MRWERALEGELLIDHRQSPGIAPEEMPAGIHAPGVVVGKGERYISATYTCPHCSTVVILNPHRNRPRNWCWHCNQRICDQSHCILMANGTLPHKPVPQVMDELSTLLAKGTTHGSADF